MALLEPQQGPLPVGPPSPLSEPFWTGAAEGRLRFPRCSECGRADFPAAQHCRNCLSDALVWETSAGRGSVYSYTVVWRPVTPAYGTPYAPAVIELDEGYSMLSNLVGLDSEEIRIGMRVAVDFVTLDGGPTLPYFRPAAE
jgi:uncharacterized OB-fold protein